MDDQKIEFYADAGKWQVIKKLKFEPHTTPLNIARFLVSVNETMLRKIYEYIGTEIDIPGLDKAAAEITGAVYDEKKKEYALAGRPSEEQISAILSKLKSPSTTKKVNELIKTNAGRELGKIYLNRRILELLGVPIDPVAKTVEKLVEEKAKMEE